MVGKKCHEGMNYVNQLPAMNAGTIEITKFKSSGRPELLRLLIELHSVFFIENAHELLTT